ncbi:MAG: hypothetical protein FWH07_01885 [Oscillospiraceae bacterium]|nr:hypothetical protein [Oscillospiraceae bacterium]
MPTNKNADLKQSYCKLLMMKHKNPGVDVNGLDEWILETRSTMDAEDVAWVENQIEEWKKRR